MLTFEDFKNKVPFNISDRDLAFFRDYLIKAFSSVPEEIQRCMLEMWLHFVYYKEEETCRVCFKAYGAQEYDGTGCKVCEQCKEDLDILLDKTTD